MFDFPSKQINYIKKLLLRQQKEVEENIKEMDEDDPAKAPALAESSEPGTESYIADVHTKTLVLRDQLLKASNSIKRALLKMREGSYGKCEKCGNKIEIPRLMVMPTAQYCVTDSKKASVRK